MKKTMRFLSIAALALVGAVMTGCSSDDNIIETPQQPAISESIVKLTISLDGGASTRALDIDIANKTSDKTFAENDQIVVFYEDESGVTRRVESESLGAGDIQSGGKKADFTINFGAYLPKNSGALRIVYPYAMAPWFFLDGDPIDDEHTIEFSKFYSSQDGTENGLQNLDLCIFDGAFTASGDVPTSITLENQFAILALTLKDKDGNTEITSSINNMTISDGTYIYTSNIYDDTDVIYVAIHPVTTATSLLISAQDKNSSYYGKAVPTSRKYEAGTINHLTLRMNPAIDLSTLQDDYVAQNGDVLTGTLDGGTQPYKISIADGATVTIANVNIDNWQNGSNWAGINCPGNATIFLLGYNQISAGFDNDGKNNYPGIYIAPSKKLTIKGDGTLDSRSSYTYAHGAGIGGGYQINCGDIDIQAKSVNAYGGEGAAGIGSGYKATCGNITISSNYDFSNVKGVGGQNAAGIGSGDGDSSSCGNITINGGNYANIEGEGGDNAAGIGSGRNGSCLNITINEGAYNVTAKKGTNATNSIGAGVDGSCATITIAAGVTVDEQ